MGDSQNRRVVLVVAWGVILAASFYKIVLQEIFHYPVDENLAFGITGALVLGGLLLTLFWQAIRSLRPFFVLFLALVGVQWLVYARMDRLPAYQTWLRDPAFSTSMLAEQSLNLIVTLAIILVLFLLHRKREKFFLAWGNTAAPAERIRWLGVDAGTSWRSFGGILAVCLSLGTLAFLVIAGRPPLDIVARALPFLPVVLLAAAMNAFYEEMTYKASFLSVLEGVVGRQHALLLMAVYFGALHYYGIPYGVVGVLMAGFLGWLLGKSMLETRGLFWAWFLHFLQDVLIFSFLAIGAVTAGGG